MNKIVPFLKITKIYKNYDVITAFRKEGAFWHPHAWAAPKRLILNRVKVEEHYVRFPGSSDSLDFTPFSYDMGNLWGNPCISHIIRYTIVGEKAPKYEYQFPRFSSYDGFCCIFSWCGKLMGKPMHFPNDEVCHRMGI